MKMVPNWALSRLERELAEKELEVMDLRGRVRELRALLVEADSNLGLWVHRYQRNTPDDLVEDVKDLRRRLHPHVAARGRVGTVDKAGPNPVAETRAGSTPVAPTTGAVQMPRTRHRAEAEEFDEW